MCNIYGCCVLCIYSLSGICNSWIYVCWVFTLLKHEHFYNIFTHIHLYHINTYPIHIYTSRFFQSAVIQSKCQICLQPAKSDGTLLIRYVYIYTLYLCVHYIVCAYTCTCIHAHCVFVYVHVYTEYVVYTYLLMLYMYCTII